MVESPLPLMDNQLTTRLATLESEIFGLKIEVAGIKVVIEADLKELQRQVQYLQDIISLAKLKIDPPNTTTRSKKRIDFDSPITPLLQRERKKQEVENRYCPFEYVPEEWLEADAYLSWPEFSAFCWLYDKCGLGGDIVVRFPRWYEERVSFRCLLDANLISSGIMYTWCAYLNVRRERNDDVNNRHRYSTVVIDQRELFVAIVSNTHWWLYVFDPKEKTVVVLDSSAKSPDKLTGGKGFTRSMVKNMLSCLLHLNDPFIKGVDAWKIKQRIDIPRQNNGYDSGVFVMKYMELWDGDKVANDFSQADIKYLRHQIAATMIMADENSACPTYIRSSDKM